MARGTALIDVFSALPGWLWEDIGVGVAGVFAAVLVFVVWKRSLA
jgi:hypothetical protein